MREQPRRTGRTRRSLLAALVAVTLLAGCSAPEASTRSGDRWDPRAITGAGTDGYRYHWNPTGGRDAPPATTSWDGRPVEEGVMTVSDPAGDRTDDNRRTVVPVLGATARQDQASCVTILGPLDHFTQPGVALRIRTDGDRTRAITVTNNVVWYARQGFNVHLADSNASGTNKMRKISTYIPLGFATNAYDLPPRPWRLCARVQGRQLSVKVWAPGRTSEPSYTDPRHGLSVRLPADWVFSGTPGFFVGHLAPGDTTALGIRGLEQARG